MNHLPYIVFDSGTGIVFSTFPNQTDLRENFQKSLKIGDRRSFSAFCASSFDTEHPVFCLFELNSFPFAQYVFIEKDVLNSEEVNIAYFSDDVSEMYPLMSPTSAFYRDITGQCIYSLLRAGHDRDLHITPAGYLSIDAIPSLRDELISDMLCAEYCSLDKVAQRVIESCEEIPAFSKIRLTLPEEYIAEEMILPIPLSSYVFLLTAVLLIMHSLSDDHLIRVEIIPHDSITETSFRIHVPESRISDADSSSLMALGKLSPSMDSLSKIASVIAFNSGIRTDIHFSGSELFTDIAVARTLDEDLSFHYRDPYTDIPSLVAEYLGFFEMLGIGASSSGGEA